MQPKTRGRTGSQPETRGAHRHAAEHQGVRTGSQPKTRGVHRLPAENQGGAQGHSRKPGGAHRPPAENQVELACAYYRQLDYSVRPEEVGHLAWAQAKPPGQRPLGWMDAQNQAAQPGSATTEQMWDNIGCTNVPVSWLTDPPLERVVADHVQKESIADLVMKMRRVHTRHAYVTSGLDSEGMLVDERAFNRK